jgi:hypothetical protein
MSHCRRSSAKVGAATELPSIAMDGTALTGQLQPVKVAAQTSRKRSFDSGIPCGSTKGRAETAKRTRPLHGVKNDGHEERALPSHASGVTLRSPRQLCVRRNLP